MCVCMWGVGGMCVTTMICVCVCERERDFVCI